MYYLLLTLSIMASARDIGLPMHTSPPILERRLKNIIWSEYYKYLSLYYLEREEAGFMPFDRLILALERAIGDIREAVISPVSQRQQKIDRLLDNCSLAFKRALRKQTP